MKDKDPQITKPLLEYLKRVYPTTTPEFDTPEREIFYNLGVQSVITKLTALHATQSKTILRK